MIVNEELINKIITYNYNNFGNEFGDALVDLKQENMRLKNKIRDIEKILKSNHDIDHIYCALSQYLNIFDYELDLKDYLKDN